MIDDFIWQIPMNKILAFDAGQFRTVVLRLLHEYHIITCCGKPPRYSPGVELACLRLRLHST
jgi:hypothetical protein